MSTATLTLTEFLLARIAEDEAVAQAAREHEYLSPARDASALRWVKDPLGYGTIFANSGRVLAECEAKRRLVEFHGGEHVCWMDDYPVDGDRSETNAWGDCTTLRILAAIYADHPDYRVEWKP